VLVFIEKRTKGNPSYDFSFVVAGGFDIELAGGLGVTISHSNFACFTLELVYGGGGSSA